MDVEHVLNHLGIGLIFTLSYVQAKGMFSLRGVFEVD